ncbi:substrate-binding domain-containing protein [uncultured Comamonas sp.]|uniref:substrate-binding domain-containing protein n=2 Tax=Comamonas TaxID=283 RepID=UPI0026314290|nr:substrate-binding domain-containing protein [uncultured Comamonas sp.]
MTADAPAALLAISSMATRGVLADLAQTWQDGGGRPVAVESVGGVDAARRVQAGEALDIVLLASDAIEQLMASGHAVAGSRVDWVRSSTAIAVRAGAPLPDIASEAALKAAVMAAPGIGYSTGPSGKALLRLFERWGLREQLEHRLVQARPGLPVGQLVAQGEASLGFQQLSELLHLPGITVVGEMPAAVAIDTVFSSALVTGCRDAASARQFLAFLASDTAAAAKQRHGMRPV